MRSLWTGGDTKDQIRNWDGLWGICCASVLSLDMTHGHFLMGVTASGWDTQSGNVYKYHW